MLPYQGYEEGLLINILKKNLFLTNKVYYF